MVVLEKLAQFQRAGHQVVLIIGDYTARVGDPSGRDTRRPVLSAEEIDANAQTFTDQAFKVLDAGSTEVRFNSEWLDMPVAELFGLVGKVTVAQLLAREDFRNRMAEQRPLSVLELLYPILQGYDSVAIRSDVELGGTDQTFNLLLGRDLQQAYGQPGQSVMTLPILPGLDGEQRMSKSLGNYVGVTDEPDEMFGKLMSIPDSAMATYYELLLGGGACPPAPPVEAKRALGAPAGRPLPRRRRGSARRGGLRPGPQARRDPRGRARGGSRRRRVPPRSTCRRCSRAPSGCRAARRRRLLAQGGVKLDGEAMARDRLDVPATRARRQGAAGGKAALRAPLGLISRRALCFAALLWLYSSVALASESRKEPPRKRSPRGRHTGRPVTGPLDEGPFLWSDASDSEAARPAAPHGGL